MFFNIILARKVAVSGKFNLIFRCDSLSSCSEKSDGRRAKEKEVEVKKRLIHMQGVAKRCAMQTFLIECWSENSKSLR